MITSTIRAQNGHYVIEVPKDEIDRLELKDGQKVVLNLVPAQSNGIPDKELKDVVNRLAAEHRDALEYLAE